MEGETQNLSTFKNSSTKGGLAAYLGLTPPETENKGIELDEVLSNNLPEPFSKSNFREFLVSEFAEENLDFYESVSTYRLTIENTVHFADANKSKENLLKLQKSIKEEYIESGSPKEVNISSALRDKVLSSLSSDNNLSPTIFDDILREIKTLLTYGPFERFVKTAKTQNLSKSSALWRKIVGIELFCLALLLFISLYCLQLFSDSESKALKSQFLRLIIFPLLFLSIANYIAGLKHLCPILADKKVYVNEKTKMDWTLIYFPLLLSTTKIQKNKRVHVIEDKDTCTLHRQIGKKIKLFSFALASLICFILVLLPPGELYKNVEFKVDAFNY